MGGLGTGVDEDFAGQDPLLTVSDDPPLGKPVRRDSMDTIHEGAPAAVHAVPTSTKPFVFSHALRVEFLPRPFPAQADRALGN